MASRSDAATKRKQPAATVASYLCWEDSRLFPAQAGMHLRRAGGLPGTRDTRSNAPSGAFLLSSVKIKWPTPGHPGGSQLCGRFWASQSFRLRLNCPNEIGMLGFQ